MYYKQKNISETVQIESIHMCFYMCSPKLLFSTLDDLETWASVVLKRNTAVSSCQTQSNLGYRSVTHNELNAPPLFSLCTAAKKGEKICKKYNGMFKGDEL